MTGFDVETTLLVGFLILIEQSPVSGTGGEATAVNGSELTRRDVSERGRVVAWSLVVATTVTGSASVHHWPLRPCVDGAQWGSDENTALDEPRRVPDCSTKRVGA